MGTTWIYCRTYTVLSATLLILLSALSLPAPVLAGEKLQPSFGGNELSVPTPSIAIEGVDSLPVSKSRTILLKGTAATSGAATGNNAPVSDVTIPPVVSGKGDAGAVDTTVKGSANTTPQPPKPPAPPKTGNRARPKEKYTTPTYMFFEENAGQGRAKTAPGLPQNTTTVINSREGTKKGTGWIWDVPDTTSRPVGNGATTISIVGGAGKIPGRSGAGTSATSNSSNPATPTAPADALVDPTAARRADGRLVTPDYFKTKEQKLQDFANPGLPAGEANPLEAVGGNKSGDDLLQGVSTTITPGMGRNAVSRRGQASSDESDESTPADKEGTGEGDGAEPAGQSAKGIIQAPFVPSSGGVTSPQAADPTVFDINGSPVGTVRKLRESGRDQWSGGLTQDQLNAMAQDAKDQIKNKEEAEKRMRQQEKEPKWQPKPLRYVKRPNPETDTGDGHVPQGIVPGTPVLTPSEIEAERLRQITLPSDGQSANPERVRVSPEDAFTVTTGRRTDGRIDPGEGDAVTPVGGSGPLPGSGPEQVDGFHKGPGGTSPDNPTASSTEDPATPKP